MCSNHPGIKPEPALDTQEDKIEYLSSYAHVVHTTANMWGSCCRRRRGCLSSLLTSVKPRLSVAVDAVSQRLNRRLNLRFDRGK